MDKPKTGRRKQHGYTVAALLGVFVLAVLLALAARLLPRGLAGLARRALRGANR